MKSEKTTPPEIPTASSGLEHPLKLQDSSSSFINNSSNYRTTPPVTQTTPPATGQLLHLH
jgi:hypothetical protein